MILKIDMLPVCNRFTKCEPDPAAIIGDCHQRIFSLAGTFHLVSVANKFYRRMQYHDLCHLARRPWCVAKMRRCGQTKGKFSLGPCLVIMTDLQIMARTNMRSGGNDAPGYYIFMTIQLAHLVAGGADLPASQCLVHFLKHQILYKASLCPVSGHQRPIDSHRTAGLIPSIGKHCRQCLHGVCWLVSHVPS